MFARPGSGGLYRPIPCLSLGLNWFVSQNDVFGYHLVNFLIHCFTGWFLYLCIRQLLQGSSILSGRYSRQEIEFIAALATLFWLLNPLQTQAVTYIVQRMASLAALFSVASIYCYLRARINSRQLIRIFFLLGAALFYLCAILSKENSATLPLIIPLIELFFFDAGKTRRSLLRYLPYLLFLGIIVIFAGFAVRPEGIDFIYRYYENRPFTLPERLLTEQRILVFHLSQLFYPAPWRLSIEHDFELSTSLLTPWTTLPAIILHISLIFIAILSRIRQPFFSFAILFFYLGHIVESTIVPLELVFEHRNYLPSLFLFVPIAQFLLYIKKLVDHRKLLKVAVSGTIIGIIIFLGSSTFERNRVWKTEESLWLDAAMKAPQSARPLAVLAIKLGWGENQTTEKDIKAAQLIEKTLSLRMGRRRLDAAQYGNLGSLYNKMGQFKKSVAYYQQGLAIAPEDANIRFSLAKSYIRMGLFDKAHQEIEAIFNKGYIHTDYFNLLGFIDLWSNNPELALPSIQQAHRYAKGRPDILLNLGKTLSMLGYFQRSDWFLRRALFRGGEDMVVLLCLIENATKAGNLTQATTYARQILSAYPLRAIMDKLTGTDERFQTVPLDSSLIKPVLSQIVTHSLE